MRIRQKDDVVSDIKTNIHTKPIIEGDCLDKYLITNNRFLEWNTVRVPHKIRRPTFPELHFASKIVINKVGTIKASYDDVGFACEQTVRVLILWKQLHGVENQSVNNSIKRYSHTSRNSLEGLSEKFDYLYLLAIINSKYCQDIFNQLRGYGSIDINPLVLRDIPIPNIPITEQQPFITHAQKMLDLTRRMNEKRTAFIDYFRGKFALQKITRNLENWHILEFADFIKELGKQKISLSSTDEFDFKPLFDREKKACVELQAQITKTDAEIDKMVYDLYGLGEEEIGVVEGLVL